MRARYYNPDIKRFINQDIKTGDIGNSQSLNRYAYCEGNPVSLVDPFGLSPQAAQDSGEESKYQWMHDLLDVAGMFFDGADVVNAFVYAAEGNWVKAGVSMACALPVVGNVVAGITKATKFAKVGNIIGKTLKMAGKAYMTVQSASTALELAGDAKLERAANGGKVTFGSAVKTLGAIAMGTLAVMSGKDLVSDVTSLTKLDAQNISFKTSGQDTADLASGKCTEGNEIGCFTAGTVVKTADGEKNVEEVNTGDYVLSEDPETGEQEYKEVVHTFIHVKWKLVHVTIEDEKIETTTEHPFYVEGVGFVAAKDLKAGDIIRTSNGRELPVQKVEIEELEEPVLVYNFEVEDYHTYYVSELGVLVHNICKKAKKFYRWLNSGKTDYQVYFGVKHDGYVYTGITKQNLRERLAQHNRPQKTKTGEVLPGKGLDDLVQVYKGLTRNQARAIEQYMIEYGPNRLNKINSISPKFNKHYNRARTWAEEYLKTHINEYTEIYVERLLK